MLKAVASLAAQYGIWAEVSLEAYMACGIGVCHGCVVSILTPTGREYQRVCKEGPVFDAITVDWKQK
jgi:dihydroorotate dehydrogenase electron transfer subunit